MVNIRIMFEKADTARFLSHLEMQQMLQRAFRRAGVPMAMSQGFNPHPKISFGSALSVGYVSFGEYLDLELKENRELFQLKDNINSNLPIGFKVLDIAQITKGSKPLMSIINRAEYVIEQKLETCKNEISQLVDDYLRQKAIQIERETKSGKKIKDIRTGIFEFQAECKETILKITALVETGSGGNVRPKEVLTTFLEFAKLQPIGQEKITRKGLFVNKEGKNMTPLEVLEG